MACTPILYEQAWLQTGAEVEQKQLWGRGVAAAILYVKGAISMSGAARVYITLGRAGSPATELGLWPDWRRRARRLGGPPRPGGPFPRRGGGRSVSGGRAHHAAVDSLRTAARVAKLSSRPVTLCTITPLQGLLLIERQVAYHWAQVLWRTHKKVIIPAKP